MCVQRNEFRIFTDSIPLRVNWAPGFSRCTRKPDARWYNVCFTDSIPFTFPVCPWRIHKKCMAKTMHSAKLDSNKKMISCHSASPSEDSRAEKPWSWGRTRLRLWPLFSKGQPFQLLRSCDPLVHQPQKIVPQRPHSQDIFCIGGDLLLPAPPAIIARMVLSTASTSWTAVRPWYPV